MHIRVLAAAAAAGVILGLQPAAAGAASATAVPDGPVLVSSSTDVSLTIADDGTATADVTIENPTADGIDVWVTLGAVRDDDCKIVSPTEAKRLEIDAYRHTKVTVKFAAACDPDREKGTDFIVNTDANDETFTMHATPPASSDPNWAAILAIYAIVGVVVAGLLVVVWRSWSSDIPPGNDDNPKPDGVAAGVTDPPASNKVVMTLPGLDASWKFADSWAANATVVTALFTALFGAKDLLTDLLGDSGKTLMTTAAIAAALSVGLAGISPMLLQSLRKRGLKRPEVATGDADGSQWAEVPAGLYVTPRGLLVAGALTLTATSGQLGVILYQLVEVEFWPWWASVVSGSAAAILLMWYAMVATRQNLTTGAIRALAKAEEDPDDGKAEAAAERKVARLRAAAVRQGFAADDVRVVIVPTAVSPSAPAAEAAKPAAIL